MDRRQYLALASGALAGLAGCTDDVAPGGVPGNDGGDGPTDTPVAATLAANGTADLDRLDAAFAQRAVGRFYLTVATEPSHGERLAGELGSGHGAESDAGVGPFLRDTDYARRSVVCVQDAAGSSHPDLEPTSVTLDDGIATLAARYPGNGATADVTTDLLLVRVAAPGVEYATVAITDMGGSTTRFSTVGRHGRSRLDEPRPLVVRNRDCAAHHVRVSATVDGELVADSTRGEYPPASVGRSGGFLTEAATHTVRASTAAREALAEATVSPTAGADEPVGVLVDVSGRGTVTVEGRPVAALPETTDATCEAASLPYESDDPSENVADPARLQWVNRSGTDRTVRLVVRGGDRAVVDRDVSMPAGDKGRTAALVAKRGVYDTSLAPRAGEGRRVDWRVDESGDDLQVLVETDGSLTVATSSLAG